MIAIIAILAAILFPVFARAKEAATRTHCLSNASQVAKSVMIYLTDFDDVMPIFSAYHSAEPVGTPGHRGVEVWLEPYIKSKDTFRSPFDKGGPFTDRDVPGAGSYWKAYGSSYRFTFCFYTVAKDFSIQNTWVYNYNRPVSHTSLSDASRSRVMRLEMMPFFDKDFDKDCARYWYDCVWPGGDYFRNWDGGADSGGQVHGGGRIIFGDGHAKNIVSAAQFDDMIVDPEGHRSAEPNPDSWSGTWYGVCD